MAIIIFPIHLITTLTILLHCVAAQQTDHHNGSISVGASLIATPEAKSWLSSSNEFALGFQKVEGKDNFLLSIWYAKIPDKTIIWYPEGGPTVSTGSKVELVDRRGLVLSDPQGKEVWSSGFISDIAYGFMNDTGNFIIVGSKPGILWESFHHPTDTILPTQVMERDGVLNSKMSNSNFTPGRFQLRMQVDGNLVLYSLDIYTNAGGYGYYDTGTYDVSDNSTNAGFKLIFDALGYLYIVNRNGERLTLPEDSPPSKDYYHRATIESDGLFTRYLYPKDPNKGSSWKVKWSKPENICKAINSRVCGLYGVCTLVENRPQCECPSGFSQLDPNNPNGGCTPSFIPTCNVGESKHASEDSFHFIEHQDIDWKGSDYEKLNPSDEQKCKTSCLKDCYCAVAVFYENQCYKKQLPLNNGYKDFGYGLKAFVKYGSATTRENSNATEENINGNISGKAEGESRKRLIVVGSTLLCTFLIGIVVLIGVMCLCFFQTRKKDVDAPSSTITVETNLPRFTYQELVKATDGFKDELGKGAFGIVYKGVIGTQILAVKKLESVVQEGQKEFESEVNTIGKTHHKNLVQLLGYCDDGEQRLLIYEYMRNGTLASFLFGNMRPSWKERSYISIGIAKGLAYLHEDCSNQIIHCDIKPQNILLDDYYNVKIGDFGLAKLMQINQSRINTGIRGTKGYVAPEWFRNTPVTFMVDVYSFGFLLFEIVSCRKCVVVFYYDDDVGDVAVLTDMAWDCYQESRPDEFFKNDLEALHDFDKLTRFMMIGLWYVQENPSLRPTMKKVTQMLEGFVEVTGPPCPFPISGSSF